MENLIVCDLALGDEKIKKKLKLTYTLMALKLVGFRWSIFACDKTEAFKVNPNPLILTECKRGH